MKKVLLTLFTCLSASVLPAAEFTLQVNDARGVPARHAEIRVNDSYYQTDDKGQAFIYNLEEAGTYPITYRTLEEKDVEVQFSYSGGSDLQTVTMKDKYLNLAYSGYPQEEAAWNKYINLSLNSEGGYASLGGPETEVKGVWTSSSTFTYEISSNFYGTETGSLTFDESQPVQYLDLTKDKKSVVVMPALDREGNVLTDGSYSISSESISFNDLAERGNVHFYYKPEDETSILEHVSVSMSGLPYTDRIYTTEQDGAQVVQLDMRDAYQLTFRITDKEGAPSSDTYIYSQKNNDPNNTYPLMGETDAQGTFTAYLPKNVVYSYPLELWALPENQILSCVKLCSLETLDQDMQFDVDLSVYRSYVLGMVNALPDGKNYSDVANTVQLRKKGSRYAYVDYSGMRMLQEGKDLFAIYSLNPADEEAGMELHFVYGDKVTVSKELEDFPIDEDYIKSVNYDEKRSVTLRSPEGLGIYSFSMDNLENVYSTDDHLGVTFYAFPGTYTYKITPVDLATDFTLKSSGDLQLVVGDEDVDEVYPYVMTQKKITLEVRDIQGQPLQDFSASCQNQSVSLDEQGRGIAFVDMEKPINISVYASTDNYFPLDSTFVLGEEDTKILIDFSKIYHSVTLSYTALEDVQSLNYSIRNEKNGIILWDKIGESCVVYIPDGTFYVSIEGTAAGQSFKEEKTVTVQGKDITTTFDFGTLGRLSLNYIENEAAIGGSIAYVTPIVNGVPGSPQSYTYFLPEGTYYVTARCNLSEYQGEAGDYLFLCNRKVEIKPGEETNLTFDFSDLSKFDCVEPEITNATGWSDGYYTIDGQATYYLNVKLYLNEGEHYYSLTTLINREDLAYVDLFPKTESFTHNAGESVVKMDVAGYVYPLLSIAGIDNLHSGILILTNERGEKKEISFEYSKRLGMPLGKYQAIFQTEDGEYTTSFELTDPEVEEVILHFVSTGLENMNADGGLTLSYQSNALQVTASSDEVRLSVFDTTGRQVLNQKVNNGDLIPVNFLSKGIYVATLSDGKARKSLKFVRP